MTTNFLFFFGKWDVLANLGETAERTLCHDPHTTLMKLRLFGETLRKFILASENICEVFGTTQVDHINTLRREGVLDPELINMFEAFRRKGFDENYRRNNSPITLLWGKLLSYSSVYFL